LLPYHAAFHVYVPAAVGAFTATVTEDPAAAASADLAEPMTLFCSSRTAARHQPVRCPPLIVTENDSPDAKVVFESGEAEMVPRW
jgi:hypothetical protein